MLFFQVNIPPDKKFATTLYLSSNLLSTFQHHKNKKKLFVIFKNDRLHESPHHWARLVFDWFMKVYEEN